MTTKTTRYSLENITNILFNGFDYKLPEETLNIISDIALQVGSPDYVKTPVFQKRENPMKVEPAAKETIISSSKRNRKGKANEVTNDEDWNNIRSTAQAAAASAAAEEKSAFDLEIENIRLQLNKLTDKNYNDILNRIFDSINKLIENNTSSEEMSKLSTIIFELATNNRFYSKIYADLYSELITKYKEIKDTFEKNFNSFTELFANIEYVDAKIGRAHV